MSILENESVRSASQFDVLVWRARFRDVAEGYRLPSQHFFIFLVHATPTGMSFRMKA